MDKIRKKLNIDNIHRAGITGKNIGIAIIDTGVSAHIDLKDSIICFKDYVNGRKKYYDDNGHGTHVAGIISGNGRKSGGKYKGIAPDSKLIIIKCLDYRGNGSIKSALEGFEFIEKNKENYNIKILNISLGTSTEKKEVDMETLIDGVEYLWRKGIIVVAAAGNNGPDKGSITAPGCAKSIITVGSSDIINNRMSNEFDFSGRGPTKECVVKPEIVCPGTNIVSCDVNKLSYTVRSGTSMSVPIVSGIIALTLEKNPNITNKQIKKLLFDTAIDLEFEKCRQGWGLINPVKMIFDNNL